MKDRVMAGLRAALLGVGVACAGGVAVAKEAPPLPLEELRTFTEVFERVRTAYVEEVDDATLLENAIKGMLSGLDPHSAYLEPDAFEDLQVNTSGEFGGLGIEVGMEDGFVRVIAPIDDTPAQKAGVKAGDMIIKLDEHAVQGMDIGDAISLMRGEPGTDIRLTIMREGQPRPIEITVTRDIIRVASVKSRMLEEGFGYVRVSQFQVQTASDLADALRSLSDQQPLKGLVLDLRNNPGGVLQAAVDVSDTFLGEGLIVYTQGRVEHAELRFEADASTLVEGVPMVVLINEGSASASEIVAGALQDHRRAVILGLPSFGKGSVQTVLPLNNDRALKLTTARYFTPLGRSIQAQGISPDITVHQATVTEQASGAGFKEANLEGHLSNLSKKEAVEARDPTPASELLHTDFQLNEALNLLKGLAILQRPRS